MGLSSERDAANSCVHASATRKDPAFEKFGATRSLTAWPWISASIELQFVAYDDLFAVDRPAPGRREGHSEIERQRRVHGWGLFAKPRDRESEVFADCRNSGQWAETTVCGGCAPGVLDIQEFEPEVNPRSQPGSLLSYDAFGECRAERLQAALS